MSRLLILPAALALDFTLGDPVWMPHPVRWMGKLIQRFEELVLRYALPLRASGVLLAVLLPLSAGLLAFALIQLLSRFHVLLGAAIEIWLIYQCLSARCLIYEIQRIWQELSFGRLEEARRLLSGVVGRDTENLCETEVCRASVETIAEGAVDGVLSPYFYAALGGAPLALAFKAMSTLDSMVGYRHEHYREFGWASARLDDFANWLPARISVLLIPLAASSVRLRAWESARIAFRDGRKHPSPNAGWPEAAFAGALGVTLGGANRYKNRLDIKPFLNPGASRPSVDDLASSWRLLIKTVFLMTLVVLLLQFSISGFSAAVPFGVS